MDKEIYIVRHGETDFNKNRIVQGSGVDSSLNELGRSQAAALYAAYQDVDFDLVVTSELVRTQQTAKAFIDAGIPHIIDGDVDEICWGIHEGKPGDSDMKQDYIKLMNEWRNENYDARIEEGESAQELADRLGRFLRKLKLRNEKKILVLTHGRSIRCLMCLVAGREIKHMDDYEHKNTGIYKVVQKGDKLEIVMSNNVDHLKGMKS